MLSKLKNKKGFCIFLCVILCVGLFGIAAVAGINLWVVGTAGRNILTDGQAAHMGDVDCIIVLGCQVHSDGTPSHMLEDRLKMGVMLYDMGAAPKILMSGDHGTQGYNEVSAMKQYALDAGVPSENVFMDHAGFSTYESMYRAKEVFQAERVIIVTQQYHLYRAVYIAETLGLQAYGVSADLRQYGGQFSRDVREVLARVKDFGMGIFKPLPTWLGEAIPISGSGELTHDENTSFY